MGLDDVVSAEALSDVQFSIAARLGRHNRGGAWSALLTMTWSTMGDGPRPEVLRMQTGRDLSVEPR